MVAGVNQDDLAKISQKAEKEKILVSWKARSRPFKKRSKEFYVNLIAVASLFGLILFLIEGLVPVLLIVALIFLFYVFSTVEPDVIDYSLTTYGVRVAGQLLRSWDEMGRYWFSQRMGEEVLVLETNTPPWKIEAVVSKEDKEKIDKVISQILYLNESPDTAIDKTASWVGRKLLS